MKRIFLNVGFLGLMVVVALNLIGCSPAREVHAAVEQEAVVAEATSTTSAEAIPAAEINGPSCASPTPEMVAGCEMAAQRILASTVRVEFHGASISIGHATVVGGRYLITHNHYPISGDALSRGGDGLVSAISVLKANGDIILLKAPLSYFSVASIGPEALVLDFQEYSGVGFFESLGVPSAESISWNALGIQPGAEVAQVDWDGTTTHVDWVRITDVHTNDITPYLRLDNFVRQGASGAGVFFNGIHIANNWTRETYQLESGELVAQRSTAALNTSSMMATGSN